MLLTNRLDTLSIDLMALPTTSHAATITQVAQFLSRASLQLTKITVRGLPAASGTSCMDDFKRHFNRGLNVAGVSMALQGTNLTVEIMTWESPSGLVWT